MRRILFFCLLAGFFFIASFSWADGESRAKTAAEKQWLEKINQACRSAIAGISCNWDIDSRSDEEKNDRIGIGAEDYPLSHYFHITWKDRKKIDEAQTKTGEALGQMLPGMHEQQKTVDTSEYEKLAEKIGAAAEAGDMAEMQRLSKEMERVSKKLEAGFTSMDKEFSEVVSANAPRDVTLSVRIKFNQFNETLGGKIEKGTLKDGTVYYRLENGEMSHEQWVEGTSYLMLGSGWKKSVEDEYTMFEHPDFPDNPYLDVRCVIVEVQAEKGRALSCLQQMNVNALKSLIK